MYYVLVLDNILLKILNFQNFILNPNSGLGLYLNFGIMIISF